MSPIATMTYDEALRVLSDVHKSFGENPPDTLDAKEEVYDTFQPHFRPGAIEDVSEQTITSFLDYGNNKHWSRLDRSKGKITRDLTSLREGLSTLVNEERKLAPRFTEAVDEVHGMGKAIATAILHVAYPDRYGVWNETSNQGMDRLDLLPEFERGASIGERYELVNDVLRALADDLSVDLWTLDFVWDRMVRGENEGQPGTATREPSSEARTDDTLKKAFETFLQTYLETRRTTDTASRTDEEGNTREVYTLMDTIQSVLERVSEAASSHLTVKKSLGRGNWVRNPWIAVYDEREHFEPFGKNKPPMAGTYVIYLFRADLTGVYLTYSQGFSRPVKELYNQDRSVGEALIQNRMERLRRRSQELQEAGFDLDSDIDLAAEGGQAPEYERSTIAHKFYQQGRVPADTDLLSDLDVLLRAYSRYMDRKHQRQVAITDAERLHQVVETVIRPAVEQGDLDPGGEEGYHHHEIIPGATPNLTPEALSDRPREAMLEALDADVNLLHHTWQRSLAKEFFRRAEPERIRDEIGALLYGPPPLTERVRDVLAWGSERTTEDGQTAKIEGTTASYLLCLSDPQEYAFCKTRGAYRPAVTALLGPDAVQKEWPERIAHARDFYKEVLRIFQEDHSELEFFDLMHVHIAFYLAEQAGAWNQQTGPTERTPEVKPARDPRVYKIAPGRNAKYWDDCREGGYICVGWDDVGDLRQFSNEGEYREAFYDEFMPDLYDRKQKASEKAGELWTLTDIEPGDLIVANRGESEVLAVGRVQEPGYEWSGDRDNHRHIVHVDWDESFRQDVHQPHWKVKTVKELPKDFVAQTLTGDRPDPYSIEEATQDLFYSKEEFRSWLNRLRTRKNMILQGPPGVGKTFVSKRLAYALMEEKAERRVQMVQFHQSYTYEDLIRGYRPEPGGGFDLHDGIFFQFCEKAKDDPENGYVFIIDEINRGNLSKIFGELMMLIEPDKRGPEEALPLAYQHDGRDPYGKQFYVPENVHLIGMMNTADRSLAMVDYALRRRFAFVKMTPRFASDRFERFLRKRGADKSLIERIQARMEALNDAIASDSNLGEGFQVGHSYFCPGPDETPDDKWYEAVVQREIAPLLEEYWFDDPETAEEHIRDLRL